MNAFYVLYKQLVEFFPLALYWPGAKFWAHDPQPVEQLEAVGQECTSWDSGPKWTILYQRGTRSSKHCFIALLPLFCFIWLQRQSRNRTKQQQPLIAAVVGVVVVVSRTEAASRKKGDFPGLVSEINNFGFIIPGTSGQKQGTLTRQGGW